MSKVDALRALREAKYARAAAPTATSRRPAAPAPERTPPTRIEAEAVVGGDALCGHRNMGGRTCTREADHLKAGTKNHRYS